jgi:predicted transcriptional regulator
MILSEQLDVVRQHQGHPPVQTVPIANDLGLIVYRVPNWPNDVSGMIRADKEFGGASGYAIFVNQNHHEHRRRFTIAHEIAHYILHAPLIGDGIVEDALLRAEGLSNKIEAQANQLAADILMPWHLITAEQEKGNNSVEDLAQIFNVSRDAMSIRLLGLSYQRARELGHV